MARGSKTIQNRAVWGSDFNAVLAELNNLQDEVDALYAKLDADAGVGDADYAATLPSAEKVVVRGG